MMPPNLLEALNAQRGGLRAVAVAPSAVVAPSEAPAIEAQPSDAHAAVVVVQTRLE